MSQEVLVEKTGRTVFITLNRPEARNSLTRPVVERLTQAFGEAASDADVRCVVLGGAGGHFCAGADLRRTFAEDPNLMDHLDGYMDAFHSLVKAIVHCPKPTIAAMDGAAVGFGADMAFACDLRVATTSAYAQEKFVNIGLMPDGGGTFWLPRLLGTARAMRAMLLADKIEAKELDALGVLAALVAPEKLREATLAIAQKLEKGPPLAFASLKAAVYASWGDIEAALRREREGQLRLLKTQDVIEGVMAWAQKREPDFKGQ
ncbi:MAG TPA: enoyl-CoA hydratase-related protein [Labilithrix sp.]